jgi:hypothetical protein
MYVFGQYNRVNNNEILEEDFYLAQRQDPRDNLGLT